MTINALDSVKVEWTGTGTGTMALGSAVSGFQSIPATFNGLVVSYEIAHQGDGVFERENGIGTYDSDAGTLTRDAVDFSTEGGSPSIVDFSVGTKHVSITLLARDIATLEAGIETRPIEGSRQNWQETSLDATSGNVTFDGGNDELIVRVTGHTVARNLTITPAPTQTARTLIVSNEGTANVVFLNHAAGTIDTLSAGTVQVFHWESGAWSAGMTFGGGGGSLSITKQTLTVGDGALLSESTHAKFRASSGALVITRVRLRHASNQASPVTVTVPNGLSSEIEFHQAEDQTGTCTIQVEDGGSPSGSPSSVATINGLERVSMTGSGSSAALIPTATNVFRLKGDVDQAIDVDGQIIEGNRARVLTGVTGTLSKEIHSGRVLVLSGNVTIPNGADDIGFNATLIAGGAQTVTFNSTTSPAMAAGDVMTVVVQSTTVIKAALVAAADLVSFT